MTTESTPLFTQGRALVIGVGSYADQRWNAPTAERDAQGLYDLLIDPQVCGYTRGNVELLTKNVTRDEIGRALKRLAAKASDDSTVLIAFTGHGALDDNEPTRQIYNLAAQDSQFSGEWIKRGTGFSITQLSEALKEIRAQKLLLLINACFAGHMRPVATAGGLRPDLVETPRGSVVPEAASSNLLAGGRGRAMITASRPDQRSYFQRDDQYSYFGQALLDGLKGSRISGSSGYVGLFELYDAIYHQVRQVTTRIGYTQEPVLHLVEGIGPFPVARYPGSQANDPELLQRRPARDTVVREVKIDQINLNIDQSFSGIKIGAGSQVGDIKVGDIVGGNSEKWEINYGFPPRGDDDEQGKSALDRLPRIANQMATANNVDADTREEVALKLRQGYRAYSEGDRAKARARLQEALLQMRMMGNSYVDSLVKKVEAALREI